MEYKTVLKNGPIDEEVNKLIKEGYKPIGGVSIVSIKDHLYMSQAMTRTAKKTGKKHFKPPTLRQVADYIKEKDYRVVAEAFMAHYTKVNWSSNKGVKIASWKGAIATFHHSRKDEKKPLNIPSKAWEPEKREPSSKMSGEAVKKLLAENKKTQIYKQVGQLSGLEHKENDND